MHLYSRETIDSRFRDSMTVRRDSFFEGSKNPRRALVATRRPQAGICRTTTSWAMIGIGSAGAFGATTYALTDIVEIPSSAETAASPADVTTPGAGSGYDMMATTSTAPSYSPKTHSRSRGS